MKTFQNIFFYLILSSSSLTLASNFSEMKGQVNWGGNSLSQTGTIGTSSNNSLVFKTNNTPRFSISNVGLVDVNGTLNAAVLCIASDCKSAWPSAGASVSLLPGTGITMNPSGGITGNGTISVANTGVNGFFQQGGNSFGMAGTIGINQAKDLIFRVNGTNVMTIVGTLGYVGIGTSTPSSLLHVIDPLDNDLGQIQIGGLGFVSQNADVLTVHSSEVTILSDNGGAFVDVSQGIVTLTGTTGVGVGVAIPSAKLHLTYGTTAAGGAPLKFSTGSLLTTPESGAVEFDGSKLYYTTSTPARKQIAVYAPTKFWVPAAMCSVATASAIFDMPNGSNPTATCYGTSPQRFGALDYADTSILSAQFSVELPSDWDSSKGVDIKLNWFVNSTSTNSVVWTVATSCVANNEDLLAPTFNAAQNIISAGLGTANRKIEATLTNITTTGCAAGETMFIRIGRTGNHASDTMAATASLLGVEVTAHRSP